MKSNASDNPLPPFFGFKEACSISKLAVGVLKQPLLVCFHTVGLNPCNRSAYFHSICPDILNWSSSDRTGNTGKILESRKTTLYGSDNKRVPGFSCPRHNLKHLPLLLQRDATNPNFF